MTNRMSAEQRLAALGAQLGARGFTVELRADGLRVESPDVTGCCNDVACAADTVTCRVRQEDGGRMWFWTSWGAPLAEADRIGDAVRAVMGNLVDRSEAAGSGR